MRHKTAIVNARIDPMLKNQAENIFHDIGLSSAEAIRLFYKQVCLSDGLPFPIKIPNKITQQAILDADSGKTYKAKTVEELFNGLK